MTLEEEHETGPELTIDPPSLFLGSGNYSILKIGKSEPTITITNTGKDVLLGRIKPLVSWLTISPYEFNCNEGESSVHQIQIHPNARQYWDSSGRFIDNLLLVISNVGSVQINGSYKPFRRNLAKTILSWLMLCLGIILVAGITVIGFFTLNWNEPKPAPQVSIEQLYTQGAATELARLGSTPSVTMIVVTTVLNTPTPALSATPALTFTFTPWPRNDYPSAEEFVTNYYTMIKNKQFNKAWLLLANDMKESYCSSDAVEPCDEYKNFWSQINRLDIISAYLQNTYDANPAEVYVKLRYTYNSGSTETILLDCLLIADPSQNSLLIESIKSLSD